MARIASVALTSSLVLAACGDSGGTSASATGGSGATTATTAAPTSSSGSGPTTGASASGTEGMTDSHEPGPTTGASASTTGDASGTSGTSDATGTSGTTSELKLDVGTFPDLGPTECGCGKLEFSYIWIANAEQGTVSKIDTVTMTEVGRYITRPDGAGNPSRTSVSFYGDVVIANRHGGLTKIWARKSDCVEKNGIPGIQTSTGPNDVLPWGQDECVAWYTEFPTTNQRPVAWAQGVLNEDACAFEDAKVWTVTSTIPFFPGVGAFGSDVTVYRVSGDTGMIEDTLQIPEFPGAQLGAYGGAVDQAGDLWFVPMGAVALPPKLLAHVRYDDLSYEVIPIPDSLQTYGIAVDTRGRIWVSSTLGAGAGRYDPETQTWEVVSEPFTSIGGLAQGADGTIWVSSGAPTGGAIGFDPETMMKVAQVTLPGNPTVKGVAIDRDELLWLITETTAYKFDAGLQSFQTYNGLTGPYTYSDMTGFQLFNTVCTPPT